MFLDTSTFYFLSQDKHWVSCTDYHNIFWGNSGPRYYIDLLRFFFGSLGCCKTGLGIGVFIRWGEWYNIYFIEGVDDKRG